MNQLFTNALINISDLNHATKYLSGSVKVLEKLCKKNSRKIARVGFFAFAGLYLHEKEIRKLNKRLDEIEKKLEEKDEPTEENCELDANETSDWE